MHDPFKTAWGAESRTMGPSASIRQKKIPGVPAGAVGCRIQDLWSRGYRWWKTADFSHSAGTEHGAPSKAFSVLREERRYNVRQMSEDERAQLHKGTESWAGRLGTESCWCMRHGALPKPLCCPNNIGHCVCVLCCCLLLDKGGDTREHPFTSHAVLMLYATVRCVICGGVFAQRQLLR